MLDFFNITLIGGLTIGKALVFLIEFIFMIIIVSYIIDKINSY